MNNKLLLTVTAVITFGSPLGFLKAEEKQIPNPKIDYPGFLSNAAKVETIRASRRLSEEDFLRMASDPSTVILDARSTEKYRLLHVKGARNLSLPDVNAADLAKVIPDKSTRVLIYCNNNFENEEVALTSKVATASLNIYTFNTLFSYGYTNVYELGPLIDIAASKLPFEGDLRKGE